MNVQSWFINEDNWGCLNNKILVYKFYIDAENVPIIISFVMEHACPKLTKKKEEEVWMHNSTNIVLSFYSPT